MTKQTTETAETKKISLPEEETEALLAQIDTAISVITGLFFCRLKTLLNQHPPNGGS